MNAKTGRSRQQIGPVHASVVSVHRAGPVEIGGSGVLINNRVVLPPSAPMKKSSTPYYVTLADDDDGNGDVRTL